MSQLVLRGMGGVFLGKEIPINGEVIIGRDSLVSNVVFPSGEATVSGTHCKVQVMGNSVMISDLGSTNGTFLSSGVRLSPNSPQSLQVGEEFYLGDRGNTFRIVSVDNNSNGKPAGTESGKASVLMSIASLVLGIISLLAAIPFILNGSLALFPLLFGMLGIVFGAVSLGLKMKGKGMAIGGLVCSIFTVVVVLWLIISGGIDLKASSFAPGTIVGTWRNVDNGSVRDAMNDMFEQALQEGGLSSGMATAIVSYMGITDTAEVTFTESGSIFFGTADFGVGTGLMSWEKVDKNKIVMVIDLSGVEIFGNTFPIKVSYNAEYHFKGKNLVINFFGKEIEFERVED